MPLALQVFAPVFTVAVCQVVPPSADTRMVSPEAKVPVYEPVTVCEATFVM